MVCRCRMTSSTDIPYVSRAGLKLEHALREFGVDVTDLVCADFGCNVGGFTDCLLKHGAALVYAIDTGYGVLDYMLRKDPRVVVMERTNALHAEPPVDTHPRSERVGFERGVDLVTIDLGWTKQKHAIPAALKWLNPTAEGRIISLIKPHYELTDQEREAILVDGALSAADAHAVFERVLDAMGELGVEVRASTKSPLTGAKSSRKKRGAGNVEYLALLSPVSDR